ncbi:hypothetical protein BS78_02G062200 [Paspalum vaginatum]|nr:hypothetical protein BS78_02G062200 [Paspalum vaginatum]
MEGDHNKLPKNAIKEVEETVANKPLRRSSKHFMVATARREILGNPLHRTRQPPTLRGFFHGHGNGKVYDDRQENMLLPCDFGQFASLPGTPAAPVVDPAFSFITKVLPSTDHVFLVDSCNGLLLFRHYVYTALGFEFRYIVCNPATEQWTAVPSCYWIDDDPSLLHLTTGTYLVFDPAVSSHFQLVLFWDHVVSDFMTVTTVHTYSSKAGVWRHSHVDWSEEERQGPWEAWRRRRIDHGICFICRLPSAFVGGLLHIVFGRNHILVVDAEGKAQRIIPAPTAHVDSENYALFVGRSQGLLHCIVEEGRYEEIPSDELSSDCSRSRKWRSYGLSVWVLHQGSINQEWVLKHWTTKRQVFGKSCESKDDYHVATMHPDFNTVFFVQHWDGQLISYDIDHQEVCALHSFEQEDCRTMTLTPYVPYLSELFLGVIGAHK